MGSPGRRNAGLDVLRVAAILLVLANHGYLSFYRDLGLSQWGRWGLSFSVASVLAIEWLFVLSGFLIGTILIRTLEGAGPLRGKLAGFWARRWLRTVPNYVLFLGVNAALVALGWAQGELTWRFWAFSQNLVAPAPEPVFFVESWSLALDEWFYLVLPLLAAAAILLRRSPKAAVVGSAALLVAVPFVARGLADSAADLEDWDARFRTVTLMHLDATGFGVLAAGANRWWPHLWDRAPRAMAAAGATVTLAGLAIVETWAGWGPRASPALVTMAPLSLMPLGTALMLPWVTTWTFADTRLMRAVGELSLHAYSVYLVHLPWAYTIRHFWHPDSRLAMAGPVAVWLALVLASSALLYHWFEKPIFDLRERVTRRVDASPFGPATPP